MNSKEIHFDFFVVYKEVCQFVGLKPIDKLILSFIKLCDAIFEENRITDQIISRSLHEDLRTVQRSINRLKKLELINSKTYYELVNGIPTKHRTIELSQDIKQLKPKKTTLSENTVHMFNNMYRRYKKSGIQDFDERFFNSLPFTDSNNEFIKEKLQGDGL